MVPRPTIRRYAPPAHACRTVAFALACAGAAVLGGCGAGTSDGSTSEGAGGHDCGLYEVPTGTDLTTPVEKFSTNVMEIFFENCGSATCHGATSPTGGLMLGSTVSEAAATYDGLVNVASDELVTMPYVTPGKPEQSYIMHKLDGDQCYYDEQCAGHKCLASMPNLGTTLPPATRDIVRRWIAQGAMNN